MQAKQVFSTYLSLISSHPGCIPWRSSCWLVSSVENCMPRTIWRPWSGFPFRGHCRRWLLRRTRTSANGTTGRNWKERLSIPAMPLQSSEEAVHGSDRAGDNDEKSQTKAYPRSTGNLPDQSAGTHRRELVGLGRRDDHYGRERGDGPPITTLTGILDQAALQGLLRRLYALGLPLISVNCVG